jgi:hypothetical protein
MQPYLTQLERQPKKKLDEYLKKNLKNGRQPQKIKMEDALIFCLKTRMRTSSKN